MDISWFSSTFDLKSLSIGLVFGLFIGSIMGKIFGSNGFVARRKKKDVENVLMSNMDDSFQILDGTLSLFRQKWIESKIEENALKKSKVVEYLPARKMMETLFQNDCNMNETCFSHTKKKYPSFSLRNSIDPDNDIHSNTNEMMELFAIIQKYSVNTSHPFFFNQLFGATDPVALAAELVSLSVNTSVYTYETAPIFTLIEKEVVSSMASIVYGEKTGQICDGIMVPGGSLSNLTALHVARNHFLSNLTNSLSCDVRLRKEHSKSDDEEKKTRHTHASFSTLWGDPSPQLVAFVSNEAHYSFLKAASVMGLKQENIIKIPTLSNGVMDTKYLDTAIRTAKAEYKFPFFVGVTSGSTVRGSFDCIEDIAATCEDNGGGIWVHVDGAWGGSALFSKRAEIRNLLKGIVKADSFTFNPHKMFGAPQQTTIFLSRHKNILSNVNSLKAKYLFDERKNGANYDLGDALFTCGRRTDAVKLWAMLKFYGISSLGKQVDEKVDALKYFASIVRQNENFLLACDPWPFNVNFFFLPKRIKRMLDKEKVPLHVSNPVIPDYIAKELGAVTIQLKLLLHEAGEMLIPYQPLSNQRAECFRLVLAGQKEFKRSDAELVLSIMEIYGSNL